MLSIVIPCLNHFEVTKRCIANIMAFTPGEFELVIVDDGSDDETKNIEDHLSQLTLNWVRIRHDTNLGFSKSVNDGIRAASGELIAIFNNDMLVSARWLDPLLHVLNANPDYGMVTGTLIEPDTCRDDQFLAYIQDLPKPYDLGATKVKLWHKGGPWLFRSEVFKMVGYFDEGFIHTQYEDSDYLLRMAIKGIKHGRVTNSYIYHYSALTQNGELKKRVGTDYRQINRDFFAKKWGTVDIDYHTAWYTRGARVAK